MPQGLTFVINPASGVVSVDLFRRAIGDINRLLLDAHYAIRREKSAKPWVIKGLHSSSPTIIIDSLLGDQEAVSAIGRGLKAVTDGTDRPPNFFTERELENLKRMQRLFRGKDKARSITVAVNDDYAAEIGVDIAEKVDQILSAGYSNLGSLTGILEAINPHGKQPVFTVWERVSRAPVRCSFPNETAWKERVKGLLEKRVRVRGSIRYFVNGVPRSVSSIAELQDATPDPKLPKAYFGAIPNAEAARDPAAFLNSLRGLGRE